METPRKKSVKELGKEKLPKPLNKAVTKIKLVVVKNDLKIFQVYVTADRLEVILRWGSALAFLSRFSKLFS